MADYCKDNEEVELSDGEFLATADDTGKNTFFSNCKDLKIMGGLHIAPGQDTTASQIPAVALPYLKGATLSFTSYQGGSDVAFAAFQSVNQPTKKTGTQQHGGRPSL
jgi:hypothetical protein